MVDHVVGAGHFFNLAHIQKGPSKNGPDGGQVIRARVLRAGVLNEINGAPAPVDREYSTRRLLLWHKIFLLLK